MSTKFLQLLTEKKGDTYEYGCAMLYVDFPMINKIHDAIDPKDLYEEEGDRTYGLEDEPHVTLLYGLHSEVTLKQVKDKLKDIVFTPIIAHNVSVFNNPKYDVLKFDIKGKALFAANKRLTELPFTTDYPEYHPHMTIAYLQPGKAKRYVDAWTRLKFELFPTHYVFSQPNGTKTKFKVNAA